jgi:hypothetical protein
MAQLNEESLKKDFASVNMLDEDKKGKVMISSALQKQSDLQGSKSL